MKITCELESIINKKTTTLFVQNTVQNPKAVQVSFHGGNIITVDGNELIQAVKRCMSEEEFEDPWEQ